MAHYIILMKLTEQGRKDIKNAPQRIEKGVKVAEAMGAKGLEFYATMGEYDYVVIGECPSDDAMMTILLGLGTEGNMTTTTLRAFTKEEFVKLLSCL